ncbi:MAG: hypothetical protein GWO20_07330 [Candidatus Korarchaeota archaeon]|nr:hypothetical protein [Candidatus Korarchaeota archaeon]NIU83260.1 hypothetical protein [Candidatus Thorarchaeota archaeon]NIW13604.1 hypothetical protein [Candidatus Thorarchaeota archaeon]NIW51700.1 hypothetical protein [Candidatus Korarchaeota archaeon]
MEGRKIDQKALQKVIEKVGWEDIKTLYETKKKMRRNGVILIGTGILILFLVMGAYLILGFFVPIQYFILISLLISLVSASLVRYGFSLILYKSERVFFPAGGKYTVFKRVACTECDFEKTTPFGIGDYVGKKTEEECPKCKGHLKISGIFAEPEHKIETIGMPILLGGVASLGMLDKVILTLDNILPISKLATKLFGERERKKS